MCSMAPEKCLISADMLGPLYLHLTQSLLWTTPSRALRQEVVSIAEADSEGASS